MFYESIADVYDFIFPQNSKQLDFIQKVKNILKDESIVEIGCATGNLTQLLTTKSNYVTGIDLDNGLIKKANEKNIEHADFKLLDMMLVDDKFKAESIDRVISFGNTLVHLPERELVKKYFKKIFRILKPGGLFVTQIINYDRIIDNNITGLTTIDNKQITFKRDYEYHKQEGYVDFITELHIKSSGKIIKNSIPLLALTKRELYDYLKNAGFINIRFYGDLDMGELTDSSVPLLFSCDKV